MLGSNMTTRFLGHRLNRLMPNSHDRLSNETMQRHETNVNPFHAQ